MRHIWPQRPRTTSEWKQLGGYLFIFAVLLIPVTIVEINYRTSIKRKKRPTPS